MQRLRSTFKRSRTPTGAEMKSQSSLEVPKQVRSASFDEIQLEAQRQESQANAELRSIANIAMATSSSLNAAATTTSSSSSSYSPCRSQSVAATNTTTTTGVESTGAVRKLATLRIPQLQTGQRSKSFDVASERAPSLLDRSASTASASGGYVTRWRSSGERENPPAQAYSCWHCACVDEYRALVGADSWEAEDEEEAEDGDEGDDEQELGDDDEELADDDDDDDDEDGGNNDDNDEEEEEKNYYDEGTNDGNTSSNFNNEEEIRTIPEPMLQVERNSDNTYYFVVVQKAYEERDEEGSDCSRREGSPEIRVTLSPSGSVEKPAADVAEVVESRCELAPDFRQRRRSLSRQEALTAFPPELPAFLSVAGSSYGDTTSGQSSPDEEEDDDEPDEPTTRRRSNAAGLVVRDIFLTVPELKRDRAASVDSCFNNNKNGKIETGYSLAVPQQSARSKSVDICLPTDAQTRYTALLPPSDDTSRIFQG